VNKLKVSTLAKNKHIVILRADSPMSRALLDLLASDTNLSIQADTRETPELENTHAEVIASQSKGSYLSLDMANPQYHYFVVGSSFSYFLASHWENVGVDFDLEGLLPSWKSELESAIQLKERYPGQVQLINIWDVDNRPMDVLSRCSDTLGKKIKAHSTRSKKQYFDMLQGLAELYGSVRDEGNELFDSFIKLSLSEQLIKSSDENMASVIEKTVHWKKKLDYETGIAKHLVEQKLFLKKQVLALESKLKLVGLQLNQGQKQQSARVLDQFSSSGIRDRVFGASRRAKVLDTSVDLKRKTLQLDKSAEDISKKKKLVIDESNNIVETREKKQKKSFFQFFKSGVLKPKKQKKKLFLNRKQDI